MHTVLLSGTAIIKCIAGVGGAYELTICSMPPASHTKLPYGKFAQGQCLLHVIVHENVGDMCVGLLPS